MEDDTNECMSSSSSTSKQLSEQQQLLTTIINNSMSSNIVDQKNIKSDEMYVNLNCNNNIPDHDLIENEIQDNVINNINESDCSSIIKTMKKSTPTSRHSWHANDSTIMLTPNSSCRKNVHFNHDDNDIVDESNKKLGEM